MRYNSAATSPHLRFYTERTRKHAIAGMNHGGFCVVFTNEVQTRRLFRQGVPAVSGGSRGWGPTRTGFLESVTKRSIGVPPCSQKFV